MLRGRASRRLQVSRRRAAGGAGSAQRIISFRPSTWSQSSLFAACANSSVTTSDSASDSPALNASSICRSRRFSSSSILFSELGESGLRGSSSSVEAEAAASSGFAAQHALCPVRAGFFFFFLVVCSGRSIIDMPRGRRRRELLPPDMRPTATTLRPAPCSRWLAAILLPLGDVSGTDTRSVLSSDHPSALLGSAGSASGSGSGAPSVVLPSDSAARARFAAL